MISVRSHRWIFPLGLALGGLVIAMTVMLSRETETVAEPTDDRPVEYFAESLQEELDRLERRYKTRLLEVFRAVQNGDLLAARSAPEHIHGLLGIAMLHPGGSIGEDRILAGEDFVPEMSFRSGETEKVRLNEEEFFHSGSPTGWFRREENRTLHFWEREGMTRLQVASVKTAEVCQQIDDWIRITRRISREPLEGYPGTVEILRSGDSVFPLPGDDRREDEQPLSLAIPVKNVFATWMVTARHPVRTEILWNVPLLLGGILLGLGLGLASWRISAAFRTATRLAEQRVSFVNQASHELRTPITNILIHSDLAADSLPDNAPRASEKIALVREEAGRLGRFVDNVLTFSRHDRGTLQFSFADVVPDDLLKQLQETFEPSFSRKGIRLDLNLNSPSAFRTDPDALSQILTNLLSNAEKYAATGKRVGVKTSIRNGELTIQVEDNGPGIPRGAEGKIFRSFQRLSSEVSEGVSGTGLGLSIARALARGLGGDIRLLDSEHGALFEVVIPEAPSSSAS